MGSRRTSVVLRKRVGWDTNEIGARKPDHASCLTDAVHVSAVISGNGTVLKTGTLIAGSADGVWSPVVTASFQVSFTRTCHTTWCNTLEGSIAHIHFMGTRWAEPRRGEGVGRNAYKVSCRVTDHAGSLTNAVAVRAVVART